MKRYIICAAVALLMVAHSVWPMTIEERRQYLEKLLQILPDDPEWRQWLQTSGELPPDFDALPRQNDLPDPLRFLDGKPVRTPAEWNARRAEIKGLFEKYALGTFPPRPKIDRVVEIDESRGDQITIRHVRIEFGPDSRGKIRVELFIPDGKGPFPVLMVPGARAWAQMAARRGYLCARYAGSDAQDDAAPLAALYPQYDFALLPRRAWAGSMVLDYLATLPQVDMRHVGIAGHSRDGKQVLIEAAFDERISAVVASSTGVGGSLPYRLAGERGMSEGVEITVRKFPTWFLPRLRFFAGREDRLPVDGNLLVALVAPRSCLIAFGLNDSVSDGWAEEQGYLSAIKAYRLVGNPEHLSLHWRYGFHEISAVEVEGYLDWLDIQFGRSTRTWTSDFLFDYDFDRWRARSRETVRIEDYPQRWLSDILAGAHGGAIASPADWEKKVVDIRHAVEWMLRDRPPSVPDAPASPRMAAAATASRRLPPDDLRIHASGEHDGWRKPESDLAAVRAGIRFGELATGDLYYPASASAPAKLPVVIWLHGYGYPMGYAWMYHYDAHPILALVKAGYAVFAFDMTGFGKRILEAKGFYDRFPHWSRFGKMVEDTRAAVDVLQHTNMVDPQRIYLFGYSLGGTVGIYAAALDPRVKGLISICGFTPMRLDVPERGDGGVARYSNLHGLIPRLGFFVGHESRIPYDFHELLAAIAPRPVLVVQPQLDRDAMPADVHMAVEQARKVYSLYGSADRLALTEPWDYNRLPDAIQDSIVRWMAANLR